MANPKGKGKTKDKGQSTTRIVSEGGGVTLRARKTTKGESLYLDYMLNGKRTPEFLKLHLVKEKTAFDKEHNKEILRQAEVIRAQRSIDLPSLTHNFIPQYKLKMNFIAWMEGQKDSKNSDGTKGMWNGAINYVKLYTDEAAALKDEEIHLPFNQITEEWLEDFKEFLLMQMDSPNSARNYFGCVLAAVRAAKKAKIILVCPADNVDALGTESVLREFHTPDEVKLLWNTPCKNELMKRAYLFACLTGLRASDLFTLKRNRLEALTLPDGSKEYRIKLIQQKVTDALYLTISSEAWELAGEAISEDPEEIVFPLTYSTWLTAKLNEWVNGAGIQKRVGWHTARHANAVIMLMNGVDIYTISKRLGHSSITITERYLHIVNVQMQKAANILLFGSAPSQLKAA
jgi:integrase